MSSTVRNVQKQSIKQVVNIILGKSRQRKRRVKKGTKPKPRAYRTFIDGKDMTMIPVTTQRGTSMIPIADPQKVEQNRVNLERRQLTDRAMLRDMRNEYLERQFRENERGRPRRRHSEPAGGLGRRVQADELAWILMVLSSQLPYPLEIMILMIY